MYIYVCLIEALNRLHRSTNTMIYIDCVRYITWTRKWQGSWSWISWKPIHQDYFFM